MKSTVGLVLVMLALPTVVRADASSPGTAPAAQVPPSRPVPFTAEQAAALETLSHHPQLAVAPDTHAAYSPKAAKIATEAGAVGWYAGYFTTLAIILITAAPL